MIVFLSRFVNAGPSRNAVQLVISGVTEMAWSLKNFVSLLLVGLALLLDASAGGFQQLSGRSCLCVCVRVCVVCCVVTLSAPFPFPKVVELCTRAIQFFSAACSVNTTPNESLPPDLEASGFITREVYVTPSLCLKYKPDQGPMRKL